MRAEIISVGDEIISGQIADTNAAWLSRELADRGIAVVGHTSVGDVADEISAVVRAVAARADVVLVSGGIGPTHDDCTREAVAAAAGAELVIDEAALEHIASIFAARGLEMPRSNAKQAAIPRGADIVRNATGTAAGFRVRVGGASVFVLPGVPREMKAMFQEGVTPLLPVQQRAIATRVLKCFGLSESVIAERLGERLDLDGVPKVAFLASEGVISVKFTACAATRETALGLIRPACAVACEVLGDGVFGDDEDTLEAAVVRLLERGGKTLAVAESCTGGLVAGLLTNVPGVSRHFLEGVVTYSNASKTRLLGVPAAMFEAVGAVSEEVARAMAAGVRERSGSDLGVGVTGIAGPSGGCDAKPVGTVHVAVAAAERTIHRRLTLRGARQVIRDRAAKHALNLVRVVLQAGA